MRSRLAALLLFLAAACSLAAQVPQLINYQGRVVVGTANFSGAGSFKFALVNTDGSATYWSNDATSTAGSEPITAVSLTVSNGLYSVLLGDATLPNMTVVPATVFTHTDVRLRVWFDDGTHGSQQLAPAQRIAAVGYAMIAATVPDGSITAAKLAPDARFSPISGWLQSVAGGGTGNDYTLIGGTYSASDPFANPGSIVAGGQLNYGPNLLFQGSQSSISQFQKTQDAVGNVINNSSNSSVVLLGDSTGYFVGSPIGINLQVAYGGTGTNGGANAGGSSGFVGTESLSSGATRTITTSGTFVYSPDGHWVTLSSNTDSVTYPNSVVVGAGYRNNQIRFKIEGTGAAGTYTLQTSSNGSTFSNVTGVTVSYSADGLAWTSTTADQVGIAVPSLGTIRLINVPTTLGKTFGRVLAPSGTVISLPPDFNVTGQAGWGLYQYWAPSIQLASQTTTPAAISSAIFNAHNPSLVTIEVSDGAATIGNALSSLSSTFGAWPYLLVGMPPIGDGVTESMGASSMMLQNAHMASYAAQAGVDYFDGYTLAKSYANMVALGGDTDIHPPGNFNQLVVAQIEQEMKMFDTYGGTMPRSVNGINVVASSTIAISSLANGAQSEANYGTPISEFYELKLTGHHTYGQPTVGYATASYLNTLHIYEANSATDSAMFTSTTSTFYAPTFIVNGVATFTSTASTLSGGTFDIGQYAHQNYHFVAPTNGAGTNEIIFDQPGHAITITSGGHDFSITNANNGVNNVQTATFSQASKGSSPTYSAMVFSVADAAGSLVNAVTMTGSGVAVTPTLSATTISATLLVGTTATVSTLIIGTTLNDAGTLSVSGASVLGGALTVSGEMAVASQSTFSGGVTTGPNGTLIKQIIMGTVTLASGVATVTNSAITTTSKAFFTLRTASVSGTVGISPGATYNAGSLSVTASATDNSTYDYSIFVQ